MQVMKAHKCLPGMGGLAFVDISLGSLEGVLQPHVAARLLCQLALPCRVIMLPLSAVRQCIGQLLLCSLLRMLCCQQAQLLLLHLQCCNIILPGVCLGNLQVHSHDRAA